MSKADNDERRRLTCERKKAYADTLEGVDRAVRHMIRMAKSELLDGRLQEYRVYQCFHDPSHYHIGRRGERCVIGYRGRMTPEQWAAYLGVEDWSPEDAKKCRRSIEKLRKG